MLRLSINDFLNKYMTRAKLAVKYLDLVSQLDYKSESKVSVFYF